MFVFLENNVENDYLFIFLHNQNRNINDDDVSNFSSEFWTIFPLIIICFFRVYELWIGN